jgi:hypothetical protein
VSGDPHALTALYALDAVSDDERPEAERHLAGCEDCREEIAEVRAALAGAVVDVAPPPSMRAAVLAQLDAVPQLPPLPRPAAADDGGAGQLPADTAAQGQAPEAPAVDELARRRAARRRFLPALAAAAAAVVLAAATGLGWAALDYRHDRDAAQRAAVALGEVASAPDAVTVAAQSGSGEWARTRLVVSRSKGEAVLIPSGTSRAPSGRTYQLWFIDGASSKPRPAGTFGGGTGTPDVLAGEVGSAAAVAVTVEPQGGSRQPTTTPVVTYTLST